MIITTEGATKIIKMSVEYASQDLGFTMIPKGNINKTVCGCGLTTVALENNRSTIILMPSVELIKNKVKQYPNNRSKYKILPVHSGISSNKIKAYIKDCEFNMIPFKIASTYDSLDKVRYLIPKADFIIDESDKLLSLTKLKTSGRSLVDKKDVISNVFDTAKIFKNKVSFISATPIPLEYMPKWVSNITQVRIDWDNTIKVEPIIMERAYPIKSLKSEIISIIEKEGAVTIGDRTFKKVIVFLNSIESIKKVIEGCKLKKRDCSIICGESNGGDYVANIPRLKDPSKLPKYLFITSSGYAGIDLYDEEAMSVIVSNTSKSYQMVDMLTDLKQATSRQRIKTNPNYNRFIYLYNTSVFTKSEESLIDDLLKVENKIKAGINIWRKVKGTKDEIGFMHDSDFITYTNFSKVRRVYKLNELAFNYDRYQILEIRRQYTKGFKVKMMDSITEHTDTQSNIIYSVDTYSDALNKFIKNKCSGPIITDYDRLINKYWEIFNKTCSNYTVASKAVNEFETSSTIIRNNLKSCLESGTKYKRKYIKELLEIEYKKARISRKPKYSDIKIYFDNIEEKVVRGERFIIIQKE